MLFRSKSAGLPPAVLFHAIVIGSVFVLGIQGGADDPDQAAYQAAMNTYRAGDCAAAISQLSAVIAAKPEVSLPLARCYYEADSYSNAVDALNTYLQKFTADEQAVVLLARAYEKQDRAKAGIDLLTGYIGQHPGSLDAQSELGRAYLKAGDKTAANAQFQDVLKAAPDYPSALFGLALIAINEERWPDAIASLKRVSAIAPDLPDAYRALGDIYARQGQCDKAIGPYSQAADLKPWDFETAKALAKCYVKLDKWDRVAAVLRTGSMAEASDPEATELVERALKDDPQAVEEYCRGVILLNPMNAVAHRILAQSLYASKQIERAKVEYLEILKLEKNDPDPEINFRLGQMAEGSQQVPEARRYYEEAAKSSRSTATMAIALARIDLALKDAPAAKTVLAKVGPPDSETPEYKTLIAEVDLRTNDLDAASNLIAGLLAQDPSNRKLLDLAAETASRQEKYADAANFLERLFTLNSQDKEVRYRLVTLYTDHPDLKGDQKAMEYLKDFVTKQGQDPEGYLLLANLYRRNKDWANAKVYFDLGFGLMPTPPPPRFSWAYQSYGLYFYNQGNLQEAYANFTQATQLDPSDARAQYQLGIVSLKLNNQSAVEQVLMLLDNKDPKLAAQLEEQARKTGMTLKPHAEQ